MKTATHRRIYQIGFNKCASTSLHRFFQKNGRSSVHWDDGRLSRTIQKNHAEGAPLLRGYEAFDCFTDIEHRGSFGELIYTSQELFREMYWNDPEGIYILNVRPLEEWLVSRARHDEGRYMIRTMIHRRQSRAGVLNHWREQYREHVEQVTRFFRDKPGLIVFDISTHSITDLTTALSAYGVHLDARHWGYSNRTTPPRYQRSNWVTKRLEEHPAALRWAQRAHTFARNGRFAIKVLLNFESVRSPGPRV